MEENNIKYEEKTEGEKVCPKCGTILEADHLFCPKCGQRIDVLESDKATKLSESFKEGINKELTKTRKKLVIPAVAIVVLMLCVVGIKFVAPKIFVSVEDLCAEGNYEKAYEKATDEEKENVLTENVISYLSADCVESLKDPSTFSLRDAYYDFDLHWAVLEVSAANSYGGKVVNYWLYTYDEDDKKFDCFCTFSDLKDEEENSYDDATERLEKALNNIGRAMIRRTVDGGKQLSKTGVKNINTLFEKDLLDDIELLDVDFNIN